MHDTAFAATGPRHALLVRAAWGALLGALGACGTPSYVNWSVRCESSPFSEGCKRDYSRWVLDDPGAALASARRFVARLVPLCDAQASVRAFEGMDYWSPTSSLPPVRPPDCWTVARLRLGAGPAPGTEAGERALERGLVEVVPANWNRGVAYFREQCETGRDDACVVMQAIRAVAAHDDAALPAWWTSATRVAAGSDALAWLGGVAALPPASRPAWRWDEAVAVVLRLVTPSAAEVADAGNAKALTQLASLRRSLGELAQTLGDGTIVTALEALEAVPLADADVWRAEKILREEQLAARLPRASEARRPELAARAEAWQMRFWDWNLRHAAAHGGFHTALIRVRDWPSLASPARHAEAVAALRQAAGAYHAGRARAHLTGKRLAAAAYHARAAAVYGETGALPGRAPMTELRRSPAWNLIVGAAERGECAWLGLPGARPTPGAAALPVRLRSRTCASDERHWEADEAYTYTTPVTRDELQTVYYDETIDVPCGPVCTMEYGCATPARCSQTRKASRQVLGPVTRNVERQGTRHVLYRKLLTWIELDLVVSRDGVETILAFSDRRELGEAQFQTEHGSAAFSGATLDAQRRATSEALAAFMAPGGGLERAWGKAEAKRLVAGAQALAVAKPEEAEEAFAQVVARDPGVPEAQAWFFARYGIDPVTALRPAP